MVLFQSESKALMLTNHNRSPLIRPATKDGWMQETLRLFVPEITPNLHTEHLLEERAYIKAIILRCSH